MNHTVNAIRTMNNIRTIPELLSAHSNLNTFSGVSRETAEKEIHRIIDSLNRVNSEATKQLAIILERRLKNAVLASDYINTLVWASNIQMGDL